MRLRLEPADEFLHPVEAATNFNESMYFNVYDPTQAVGGFFRLGNRPNEGYAEMTTCLFLPGGRVGFMFARPEITSHTAFDAGGMTFTVVRPFEELEVSYTGKVVLLARPLEMADPRRAFAENPWVDCWVRLRYRGLAPPFGGEPEEAGAVDDEMLAAFARGHYEQHVSGDGTVRVDDETWEIRGHGLRDHSWGPRHWQTPWWYRWLTANFGNDFGFVLSVITTRDGRSRVGGMVLEGGRYERVDHVTLETDWTSEAEDGSGTYHRGIRAWARTAGRDYEVRGEVLSLIPLRHRRTTPEGEELVTRISEGLTRWTCDGRTGYGLSEYLDQIVDGKPVGAAP